MRTPLMTPDEARAYLNYLLSLSIRRDQAVGPLASAFIRDNDLDALGLLPDEQLSLYLAAAQSFAEPRRFSLKVEFLERAKPRAISATRLMLMTAVPGIRGALSPAEPS